MLPGIEPTVSATGSYSSVLTPMDDDDQPPPPSRGRSAGHNRCSVMKNISHQVTMNNTIHHSESFLYILVPF